MSLALPCVLCPLNHEISSERRRLKYKVKIKVTGDEGHSSPPAKHLARGSDAGVRADASSQGAGRAACGGKEGTYPVEKKVWALDIGHPPLCLH